MKHIFLLIPVVALAGCASSGIVSTDSGTYMVSESGATLGISPPVKQTASVYQQAHVFCAEQKGAVETVRLDQHDSAPGRLASAALVFRCGTAGPSAAQRVTDECKDSYAIAELDPIRNKVELYRSSYDAPPSFAVASLNEYPTELERPAIAKWATLRDQCIARQRALPRHAAFATVLQATVAERDFWYSDEVTAKVSALVVALYQRRLSYGEFAQKRYEFAQDGASAEREYRQAVLIDDQQRAIEAQQLAEQNFQNRLNAWSSYIQAVNVRQPQQVNVTVH